QTVPWYRERFAALRLKPADIRGVADLPLLPILTKLDVVEHGPALRATTLPQGEVLQEVTRSSGTTGRPAVVLHTRSSALMFSLLAHRRARWARMDPTTTYATIRISAHFPRRADGPLPDGEVHRARAWSQLGYFFHTGPSIGFNLSNPIDQQLAWLR